MEHYVYHYHPISRIYQGQSVADPDQLIADNYLIPAFATDKPVPKLKAGEIAVFDVANDLWLAKTADVSPDATPEEKRQALLAAVTAQRLKVETGGLELPNGVRVGTDREDQAIITGAVSAAQLGIKEYDWKGADGSWVKLSAAEITQIGTAVAMHVQGCFSAERKHCEAIAATPDDKLDDYDINVGWPT